MGKKIRGTFTVMVTAFDADNGLDLEAQSNFTDWQVRQGINGLIPLGSTGEFLSMSFAERAKVAVVEKTIGTVTPDKSTVMFKIFCTDEAALYKFIEGTEVSKPIMSAVLDSYSVYHLTKAK